MEQEQIFKALADEHRRALLDMLFERDGQTLAELCAPLLPQMTRFGVMKHLQILEDAGLITTQKVGREKHHYLNPVPIQMVYDRWVSKYAQPWSQTLAGLKYTLEGGNMQAKPAHVMHIFIRTTPEKLWHALTDGEVSRQYYFNTRVTSTWELGAPYHYLQADGAPMIEGEVLEIHPPNRLVTTFRPLWGDAEAAQHTTRVVFEIEQMGDACKLTLTHHDLNSAIPLHEGLIEGWANIFSNLKSLLETGEPLHLA